MSLTLSGPSALLADVATDDLPRPARPRLRMSPPVPSPDERTPEDAQLIRRMADRDQAALAALYDRFATPLFSTAMRLVGDRAEAEDLVRDVFVALWDKAADFDDRRGSAFAWAVTLVRNRAIDRVRSRRRHGDILDATASVDLGAGDRAEAVRAAVAALPPEQKHALELAFFGGLTQQEIAARLAEPLGTVQARLRRGLLKLQDLLPHRP